MLRWNLHLLLGALALCACSEPSEPACGTQIAEDVCSTPAQPRGAQAVTASTTSGVDIALPPLPLAEGRYVLVARSASCTAGADASLLASVQGVLEVSGCVLRRTLISGPEPARVEVFELGYAEAGVLALLRRCPLEEAGALRASYGSDGVTIELGRLQAPEASSDALACDTRDTWELR